MIVILPIILRDTDGSRAKDVLAPFLTGPIKPVLNTVAVVPDFLAVSHSADKALATAPKRLTIRGTLFSDFFPELLGAVWSKWLEFTESSEEVRSSAVLWDCTIPDKMAAVKEEDTALNVRSPHYWMAVQGRCVL